MDTHAFAAVWVERAMKARRLAFRPSLISALRHGVLPSMEHVRTPFGTPATVLDVGASRGQFAILARSLWPTANVICFEPLENPRRTLEAVAKHRRIDVRPIALDDHTGDALMNVARDDDSSSLLSIGGRQVAEFPGTRMVATARVSVARLDDLNLDLRRPCLMKIDTQGSELRVIRGAARTLREVDEVYVECSFVELYDGQPHAGEVIGALEAAGLDLVGIYNVATGRAGDQLQADFLFRRRETG